MRRVFALLGLGLLAVVGCSSAGGSDSAASGTAGASCGKPGRSGETSDGCGVCSAGQYCDAEDFHTCKPGCTSDANCGEAEQCVRCGTDAVGTCQSCSRSAADACGSTGCTRDTFWDQDCVAPGKGYTCPSDMEPSADLGTCSQGPLSTVWCCGGAAQNSCMRDTTLDVPACAGDPTHGKAYQCFDPADEPSGDCVAGMIPGTFCCTS